MDSIKNFLLKIIAFFCCTNDSQIIDKNSTEPSKTNTQQTEEQISNDENQLDQTRTRMFNGALSSRVQGQLFLAIEQANHIAIQDALLHGADINTAINGLDPLQYAIANSKDYIIDVLVEKGAIIKPHHIDQALSYERIYETNLRESDMTFPGVPDKTLILRHEIRKYHMIASNLQLEMARQQRKKDQANNATMPHPKSSPYAHSMASGAAAPAQSGPQEAKATPKCSLRPRLVKIDAPEDTSSSSDK